MGRTRRLPERRRNPGRLSRGFAVPFLMALSAASTHAYAGDTWSFQGYIKTLALVQQPIAIEDAPADLAPGQFAQSQNALRVMLDWFATDRAALQLHYEIDPVFHSAPPGLAEGVGATYATPGNRYRFSDIQPELNDGGDKHDLLQNLDRLNLRLRLARGDLTIGRQAIAFGFARVINPTDIFLPFDVRTVNQEYRIGVDAVRYQRQLGALSELDMGVILGADADRDSSALYLRGITNVDRHDLSAIYARFAHENLYGLGIHTALGEVGLWCESGYVTGTQEYLRSSIGIDYTFSEKLFAMVEYHFNGAGTDRPDEYQGLFLTSAYRFGGVFLLGRHYLVPSLSWTLSPLFGAGLQALYNLDDHSTFVALSGQYSLTEDLYLNVGYYRFAGAGIRFRATLQTLELGSEYGGNPDSAFISLRYYF